MSTELLLVIFLANAFFFALKFLGRRFGKIDHMNFQIIGMQRFERPVGTSPLFLTGEVAALVATNTSAPGEPASIATEVHLANGLVFAVVGSPEEVLAQIAFKNEQASRSNG